MTSVAEPARTARILLLAPLARLRDRLGASDPAFSRLRLASRAMLSLIVSVALLAGFSFLLHPLPFAAFGLSFVISFNGALAVRDKGRRAQAVTRAIAFMAAIVSVTAASLLANWPLVADLAFLAVIFTAVYVRRFGQRWTAVGMIGFMAFFMGDYMRPQPADLIWVALAAAVAFCVTQLVTNVVLPDDPEHDFRRALASLEQRVEMILSQLLEAGPVDRPRMQKQLGRLRDIAMMAEGFIPQGEDGALAARGTASDLAIALFDVQLVVERLARASYTTPPPRELVQAMLRGGSIPEDATDPSARLLVRLQRARTRLAEALAASPSPFVAPKPGGGKAPTAARPSAGIVPAELQAPLQVTLACAIAMGIGLMVSPMRWYWAVITAFIVFNNTRSRGDTAVRALQRSLGTFAGLIGGTILATLLHGQPILSGALMPVCFFFAFYFLQVSYSVMIFFITLALALLYGLTGSFAPEVLLTRLEETMVGAAAGALVAFVVFPARTAEGASAALARYLDALRDLVGAAKGRAAGEPEPLHLLARSRLLDRSYTELATTVRPIGGPWAAVTRFGEVREKLLLLSSVAHWGRVLARGLPQGQAVDATICGRIAELAAQVEQRIDAVAAARDSFFERPRNGGGEEPQRRPVPISEEADPVLALEVIGALLARAVPAAGEPG